MYSRLRAQSGKALPPFSIPIIAAELLDNAHLVGFSGLRDDSFKLFA
jgi:hypothetical protein